MAPSSDVMPFKFGVTLLVFMASISTHLQWCYAGNATHGPTHAHDSFNAALLNYDKNMQPNFGEQRVDVRVQMAVLSFGPVNEKQSSFDIDIFLRQRWLDDRLVFSGNLSVTLNEKPERLIWIPDTSFPTSIESKTHSVTTANSRIVIHPDGTVYVSQRVSLTCKCHMGLRKFPMDTQKCGVDIESYSFSSKDINYEWLESLPIEIVDDRLQIEGYVTKGISTTKRTTTYANGPTPETFSWLRVEFELERNFNYYLFHYYSPSCILVMMSWATFWLPGNTFPARVALIVTTLLASVFIVQGGISQLVRTSYRTSLEIFFTLNIVFIALCMLEYLMVVNIPQRTAKPPAMWRRLCRSRKRALKFPQKEASVVVGETNRAASENGTSESDSIAMRLRSHQSTILAAEVPNQKEDRPRSLNDDCHFVDAWSRVLFPVTYVICVIVYARHYT